MNHVTETPDHEPTRDEIDRTQGVLVVEFGAGWCPHCQALRPLVREMLERFPQVRHLSVEDGKGKPLGRSFRVKLWPNLVFLRDGKVERQLARPRPVEVREAFEALAGA